MVGIGPKFIIMLPVLIVLLFASIAVLVLLVRLCIKKPWVGAIIAAVFLFMFATIFIPRYTVYRRMIGDQHQPVPLLPSVIQSTDTTAAIWSPGIEDEFKADIYPSKISAVRSLGRKLSKYISHITESGLPDEIIVYQNSQDIELVE